jgi:membrane protease YdiL (CAAX protease family)
VAPRLGGGSGKETGTALAGTLLAFIGLWVLLDRTAAALGSLRGEAGVAVCLAVLAAAIALELALSPRTLWRAVSDLGLQAPGLRALIWSTVLGLGLLCFFPLFALATGARLTVRADAALLALGMFAQGGIAEEVVFRGFLFRRLRLGRSFWQAARIAALPFVAVHALLFLTLDFPIAMASLLLALSLSFPLAWLFERSGGSILPPAIVHGVLQSAIKLVEAGDQFLTMAIAWMIVGVLAPWALFLLRPDSTPIAAR